MGGSGGLSDGRAVEIHKVHKREGHSNASAGSSRVLLAATAPGKREASKPKEMEMARETSDLS